MTAAQSAVLRVLKRKPMSVQAIAMAVDGRMPAVQRTLDALFRRNLVTVASNGYWVITERGRGKVAA